MCAAAASAAAGRVSYRFVYFHLRGAGELCRLTLALSGAPWEDIRPYKMGIASAGFSVGDLFPQHRAEGHFDANLGRLPLLQVVHHPPPGEDDEKQSPVLLGTLGQSHSIARFVAWRHGLAGVDAMEQAKADVVYEHCRDIKSAWYRAKREKGGKAAWFSGDEGEGNLQSRCRQLEQALSVLSPRGSSSSSSSPWCLGGPGPTLADVAVYHLLATPEASVVTGITPSFFDGESDQVQNAYVPDCPRLADSVAALGSLDAIRNWESKRPETFN